MQAVKTHAWIETDGELHLKGLPCKKSDHVEVIVLISEKPTEEQRQEALKRLADETGGRAFFPFKAEDLSESFQDISAELRSQYTVAYRSSNPARDGSFRSVRIETDRKNLRVKARKGYYAAKG